MEGCSVRMTIIGFVIVAGLVLPTNTEECINDIRNADVEYRNITILQKTNIVPIKIYSCSVLTKTITISNKITKESRPYEEEDEFSRSDCRKIIEKRELYIQEVKKTYPLKMNETFNDTISHEGYTMHVSITINEYTTNVDLVRGNIILANGYDDCYYKNYSCFDKLNKRYEYWDELDAHASKNTQCDGVFAVYKGPAKILTVKRRPAIKSILLENLTMAYSLQLDSNISLCERLNVTTTDNKKLLIMLDELNKFEKINSFDPLSRKKIDLDKVVHFKAKKEVEDIIIQNCKNTTIKEDELLWDMKIQNNDIINLLKDLRNEVHSLNTEIKELKLQQNQLKETVQHLNTSITAKQTHDLVTSPKEQLDDKDNEKNNAMIIAPYILAIILSVVLLSPYIKPGIKLVLRSIKSEYQEVHKSDDN